MALLWSKSDHRFVSAATGKGVDELAASLAIFAEGFFTTEPALVTRERQHVILREVWTALHVALERAQNDAGEELVAEELRHAAQALGRLSGRVDVEDVLDRVFSEFCIGK
jgi:tRNA modification GTPase